MPAERDAQMMRHFIAFQSLHFNAEIRNALAVPHEILFCRTFLAAPFLRDMFRGDQLSLECVFVACFFVFFQLKAASLLSRLCAVSAQRCSKSTHFSSFFRMQCPSLASLALCLSLATLARPVRAQEACRSFSEESCLITLQASSETASARSAHPTGAFIDGIDSAYRRPRWQPDIPLGMLPNNPWCQRPPCSEQVHLQLGAPNETWLRFSLGFLTGRLKGIF